MFKAKKEKGVTEHKASKHAAVDFLSGLLPGEMKQLLLRTEPGVAAQLALMGPVVPAVVVEDPPLRAGSYATGWGDAGMS